MAAHSLPCCDCKLRRGLQLASHWPAESADLTPGPMACAGARGRHTPGFRGSRPGRRAPRSPAPATRDTVRTTFTTKRQERDSSSCRDGLKQTCTNWTTETTETTDVQKLQTRCSQTPGRSPGRRFLGISFNTNITNMTPGASGPRLDFNQTRSFKEHTILKIFILVCETNTKGPF